MQKLIMAEYRTSTPEERATFEAELSKITDYSGFHMDDIPAHKEKESSSEAESETNTTEKEVESEPVQTQEDRGTSEDKVEQEQSKDQSSQDDESQSDINNQESESNRTDPVKPKESRAAKRIQELLERDKAREKEISELRAKLEKGTQESPETAVKSEPEYIVPPPGEKRPEPYKSKWTIKQLRDELQKANLADEAKQLIAEEIEAIKESNQEQLTWDTWEIKNKQAYERQAYEVNHYTQEAVKIVPELNDANSQAYKEFAGILNQVKEVDSQFLSKPKARVLLAQATKDRMASLRLDAALKENETLKKEIQRFKKSAQPLAASNGSVLGESAKDNKPLSKGDLASRIRQLSPTQRAL